MQPISTLLTFHSCAISLIRDISKDSLQRVFVCGSINLFLLSPPVKADDIIIKKYY